MRARSVCVRVSTAPTVSAAGAPPGRGDVAVAGAGAAVVPGRRDDERVERERPGGGARLRAVGEAGERLGERDQRDAGGVVRVAVVVRVDRALEPGDHLVAARVDRPVPERVGLPAGDADRQHGRAGRDAGEARRARRAPTSRPAICVPWRSTCVGSSGSARGERIGVAADDVDALAGRGRGGTARARSTPVSSSAIVTPRPSTPGTPTFGRWPESGPKSARDSTRAEIDAGYATRTGKTPATSASRSMSGIALGSTSAREAVEHARVAVVGLHGRRPASASRVTRSFCAASVVLVQARSRRVPTMPPAAATRCASDGVLQHDDDALRRARRAAREPTSPRQPAAVVGGGVAWPALLPPVASRTAVAGDGDEREQERMPRLSARRTHRGQDIRGTGRGPRSAPPRRSSPRCRCVSASGARAASASASRSSELAATPPTTAIRARRSAPRPRGRGSTSARTIARWYEAARSARRASSSSGARSRVA